MPSSPYVTSLKTTTTEPAVRATHAPSNDCCLCARRFASRPSAVLRRDPLSEVSAAKAAGRLLAASERQSHELLVRRERIEALALAMRVAKKVKAFKRLASYLHAAEQVGPVARQNEGWFKQTQAKTRARA